MNSKQRRKARRDAKYRGIEKTVIVSSRTIAEMNDPCPYFYEKCGEPRQEYNFDCFGKYKLCQSYNRLAQ